MNDPTTAPLTFWQKSPNCWQIASQFVVGFPLCAKYTMAAAAAPAAVVRVSATYSKRVAGKQNRKAIAPKLGKF
ncbi:hypothetical protein SAY86_017673 [Trapa natans]|uniref:Uncharacterized protein n=1 Tax=Trapa natans TaxID=22666 RepID=A0AAN7R2X9_TRANT|nr:hypothetical protein SAY86_017673 [Trapa natans]